MTLSVVIKKCDDGMYVAVSPTLPGCVTKGTSLKDALDKHRDRIRSYIASSVDMLPDSIEFCVICDAA